MTEFVKISLKIMFIHNYGDFTFLIIFNYDQIKKKDRPLNMEYDTKSVRSAPKINIADHEHGRHLLSLAPTP